MLRNRALKFKVGAKPLSSDAHIIKDFCEPTEHNVAAAASVCRTNLKQELLCRIYVKYNTADSAAFSTAMCKKTEASLCRYIYRLAWR
ncbi:hypothetical protein [uncultured Campylobacter sp.]|uniref:hypothetical protein n=1 Tax=uncultured Campylobacter sp. TaxID=218934 RepID=UPI002609F380|nr:hypothetical protein [uncultured Campylobacter sp.]